MDGNVGQLRLQCVANQCNRNIGGLHLLAAYTWSKSIDDSSGFGDVDINPYDHRLSRSLSAFDIPQNFVVSYAYDLPFTKYLGRHRLWDGWQISGITRLASGLPILLADSADPSLCGCSGADLPNFNGQPVSNPIIHGVRTIICIFNE